MCAECTQGDDGLVSLFTREWIEILPDTNKRPSGAVSLFTREWIEISDSNTTSKNTDGSPSLRGSGLKSLMIMEQCFYLKRLPLYEGVD